MLQPGDQILYIDNTCLKNKSLDEIKQMLKGNEEIVKLKIKKDENNTGKNETTITLYLNTISLFNK